MSTLDTIRSHAESIAALRAELDKATKARNRAIARAQAAGNSYGVIAQAAGITRAMAFRIVNRLDSQETTR